MSLMETVTSGTEAVEDGNKTTTAGAKKLALTRPKLTLTPRNTAEAFLRGSDAATPSPMTFVSSLFADQDPYAGDQKSFSQLLAGAIASPTTATTTPQDDGLITTNLPSLSDSNIPPGGRGSGSDGLPGRANTARFKSMMPPRLPIPRSPYLTIPPGLSPTTLLESPVLLPASLAEPSPTTGTYLFPPYPHDSAFTAGAAIPSNFKDWSFGQDGTPACIFKSHPQLPNSPLASMGPYGLSHRQALAQVQAQANSQLASESAGAIASAFESASTMPSISAVAPTEVNVSSQPVSQPEPMKETVMESTEKALSQSATPAHPLPHLVERPSEDGYNWRKYGQKQVKGSEYPRSYYKCTHPNCPVKKKVERSYDGQITEIVYKGDHSHAKPQSTRRNHAMSSTHVADGLTREGSLSSTLDRATASFDMKKADSDRSQPAGGLIGTPEPSLASTSEDEDGGDDESDIKRPKIEKVSEPIPNPPLRTIREPRVVVQTMSEVDILDDGYRWRKYGQKVVKGNPYPRSYYKCTSAGCTVRKHVERSSTDPKSVITTYEGKHNHDVPAARNSHHEGNVPSSNTRLRLSGWGSSGEGRGATSLQEQLFGKLLEVADMEANNAMQRPLMYNQDGSQLATNGPSQAGASMMASNLAAQGEYLGQGAAGLRPKEEPEEVHSLDAMPSAYQPRLLS